MREPNQDLIRARDAAGLTRAELATRVNAWIYHKTGKITAFTENHLAKYEHGVHRWPQELYRRALRAVLGVATDQALGFRSQRRPRRSAAIVDDVKRIEFLRAAAGVSAGMVAGGALADLLPTVEASPMPSSVGRPEIEWVRGAARAAWNWDMLYGGGGALARKVVATQLRASTDLLNVHCPGARQGELFAAVGDLADAAGFMALDVRAHDDAWRLFKLAHTCAAESDDWDLRAGVLSDMARHAYWRGDIDASLTAVEQARVRLDRLTPTRQAALASLHASALARLGRVEEARRAVGEADEAFADANLADAPTYVSYYDAAEHNSITGQALADPAMKGRYVDEAIARLSAAISDYRDGYARSRALAQVQLANLMLTNGDPQEAAAVGADAVSAAGSIRSQRLYDSLRQLHQLAGPHAGIPEVAELRHRIRYSTAS